jgi:hypothetical protein
MGSPGFVYYATIILKNFLSIDNKKVLLALSQGMYRIRIAIVVFFFGVLNVSQAWSQSYLTKWEVGIELGGSQYFGDLNENYGFRTISPAGGIYFRQHMNPYISLKAVSNYTHVGYDDKYNTNPYDQLRNLNFQSTIIELAVQAEFNFFKFISGDKNYRFTPYLTGGIGAFYYNPYTYYQGVKYYLQPLGTEGQDAGYAGRKYSDFAVCFPLGVGVKAWIVRGVNMSFEIADRLTTTDYLDDVSSTYVGISKFPVNSVAAALQDRSIEISPNNALGIPGKQRGNTSSKDQYLMALLTLSWHFTTYRCPANMDSDFIRAY